MPELGTDKTKDFAEPVVSNNDAIKAGQRLKVLNMVQDEESFHHLAFAKAFRTLRHSDVR